MVSPLRSTQSLAHGRRSNTFSARRKRISLEASQSGQRSVLSRVGCPRCAGLRWVPSPRGCGVSGCVRGVRGVRGRARPRAGSAEQGGAASAAHNPQRRPSPAARRWVGRTASPPAGSPLVACRPPSARKPARSRGAAPEPERESPADPTPGRTRGLRDLYSLPPRDPAAARSSPALAPAVGLRQRSGGTRAAPGARVSGRARLPGFSRAAPPAFASAAAARRGGVCMGSALGHREGQGGETCLWGEVGSLPGGAPNPAGRVGTGGAGRAGRFVSGRGDRQQTAAPLSAAPFASLPCSPGRPHAGSAG